MKFTLEVKVEPLVPGSGTYLAEGIVRGDNCKIADHFDGRGSDKLSAVADMLADAIEFIRQGKLNAQCLRSE